MAERKDFHSLPRKTISQIFTLLPLTDRKNVRLTCRSWYQCATTSTIIKNEKFVFRCVDNSEDIALFLRRPYLPPLIGLNLEFKYCSDPIDNLAVSMWETYGPRIRSLQFECCKWSDETMNNIITNCVNLISFKMLNSSTTWCHGVLQDFLSPDSLDILIKSGFRHKKLQTFGWHTNQFCLPQILVKKILILFPCMKHFKIGIEPLDIRANEIMGSIYESTGCQCTIPLQLDDYLELPLKLESFAYNIPTDGAWMEKFIMKSKWASRLTEFQILLASSAEFSDYQRVAEFFSVHENLRIIKLRVHKREGSHYFARYLMFSALEECPHLRELHILHVDDLKNILPDEMMVLDYDEFKTFFSLTSKLQCLVLMFQICFCSGSTTFRSLSSTKHSLRKLTLSACGHKGKGRKSQIPSNNTQKFGNSCLKKSEEIWDFIFQSCPKLEHVELITCSDGLLQRAFKYLPNVKILSLEGLGYASNYGLTGLKEEGSDDPGFHIKTLQGLEHLQLNFFKPDFGPYQMTESILNELQFPHLKILSIRGIFLREETILNLALNLPILEKLTVTGCTWEELVLFCKHSKHLTDIKCLCFKGRFNEVDARELFNTHFNLRRMELVSYQYEIILGFTFNQVTKNYKYILDHSVEHANIELLLKYLGFLPK